MALDTVLGEVTEEQLRKLPGKLRNPQRVQQHIEAFGLRLQGVSFRGIQEHFGWKSLSSAQNSVRRGEELAKVLDLDKEKIKLKLAAFFDELADITIQQVKDQAANGRVTQIARDDGSKEVRKVKGVDPRMLGEAGRGLIRFAEFAGLMDRAPEVNQVVSMVQLNGPADGVSFADKWAQPAVDVTAQSAENDANGHESGHTEAITASDALQPLERPTVKVAVAGENSSIPGSQGRIVTRGHEHQTPNDVEVAQ